MDGKNSINYKNKRKYIHFTYRVNSVFKNQVTFRHCTESQVTYNLKHCTLPVLHCVNDIISVKQTFGLAASIVQ